MICNEIAVFMLALSDSAPALPFEGLQARIPRDDFGVLPLEHSSVVSSLTRLLSLTSSSSWLSASMESLEVLMVILSPDSSTTSRKSSSLSLAGDDELSTVPGDFDLTFMLHGLCAICGLSHSRF